MSDSRKCSACGQAHGDLDPCPADSILQVFDDVEFCALPDPCWDIEGVVQEGSLEIGFGPSDAGKSTLYADRACCLATGTPWLGLPILRPGPVVVLVFEGTHAFKKKIRAWKSLHGFAPDKKIGVYIVTQHVNVLEIVGAFGLVKVLQDTGAHELIVDTLAQSICADEENEQMQIAVNHAAMIRRATGARVVFIHHSGKNRKLGARGGTALTAAADTVLSLDEEKDGHVLRCVRQRDGERFLPMFLKLTKTADGSTVLFERLTEGRGVSMLGEKARLTAQVLAWLRANPGAVTDTIAPALGRRKADVVAALAALLKAGTIAAEKKGKGKGWRVVES